MCYCEKWKRENEIEETEWKEYNKIIDLSKIYGSYRKGES